MTPTTRLTSLSAHIAEHLGKLIVRGDLGPSDVLPTEQALCVQFGVSRTIVREAMKALSAKGLLDSRPKRGARVRARDLWTPLDVDILNWIEKDERFYLELIEMRRIVEIPAAELATERATDENIAAMDHALAEMVEAEAENRPRQFKEADMKLHREVARACHNQLIQQLLHILDPFIGISHDATIHLLGTVPTGQLHRDLVDGIRHKNAVEARAAMRGIIDQAWLDLHHPKDSSEKRSQNSASEKVMEICL